jgi:hypothetical protein
MQILPVDLTALILGALGISIVLVPVLGLTARFALKPVVEALARVFEVRGENDALRMLERRIDLQEQELMMLQQTMRHLTEGQDFDRRLTAGESRMQPAPAPHPSDGAPHKRTAPEDEA